VNCIGSDILDYDFTNDHGKDFNLKNYLKLEKSVEMKFSIILKSVTRGDIE
jgi:hypothetical protein